MKIGIKKAFVLPLGCLALLLLASCGYFEASENKSKLEDIRIGMTQAEVREIMGEPPEGVFQGKKVVFYYTDPKWYDGMVTRDECTPFVFDEDEDRLIGFGYDYFRINYSLSAWSATHEASWRDSVVPRMKVLDTTGAKVWNSDPEGEEKTSDSVSEAKTPDNKPAE